MPQITLGDLTQSKLFGARNASLKDAITNLSTEVTTGLAAKTTEAVRGDYSALSGIEASLTRLTAVLRADFSALLRTRAFSLVRMRFF